MKGIILTKTFIYQNFDSMFLNLFKFATYNPEEKFELIATSLKNAKAVVLL